MKIVTFSITESRGVEVILKRLVEWFGEVVCGIYGGHSFRADCGEHARRRAKKLTDRVAHDFGFPINSVDSE